MINEQIRLKGDVEILKEWRDGRKETLDIPNTVLLTGRRAMTKALANAIGDSFEFYIISMDFGNNGTHNGVKKFVDAGRNGLFGTVLFTKPVLGNIDNSIPTQAIFTSVVPFEVPETGTTVILNEMALKMANGEYYSMTTFPDLTKTHDMQITFNWRLNYI